MLSILVSVEMRFFSSLISDRSVELSVSKDASERGSISSNSLSFFDVSVLLERAVVDLLPSAFSSKSLNVGSIAVLR